MFLSLVYVTISCFLLFLFHIRARKLHASCTQAGRTLTRSVPSLPGGGRGRKIETLGGVCGQLVEILAAVRTQMTAAKLTD